ncbi:unnamed protein product [Larinioides sclopetarius]|uniref:Uncharacterized protein n=1 Tax=Larinioides sclopetarius TaxID=280406 RepID=A0AAV2AF71_9ARAC
MVFPVVNFSTYFCMIFSAPVIIPLEIGSETLQIDIKPETLSEVISSLHEIFRKEFNMVINELMAAKTTGYRSFTRAILAKCLKISENKTTYLHFLLVCTLINGIIKRSFENKDCFFVPNVCFCCLVSAYERCYKEFDKVEGNALGFHITVFKQLLATRKSLDDKRKLPIFVESNVNTIIESLVGITDTSLKDSELALLEGIRSTVRVEFFDDNSTSSESSLSRDVSTEGAAGNALVHEDSSESISKSSESQSPACLEVDVLIQHEPCSDPTCKLCESSPVNDTNMELGTALEPMYEDSSESMCLSSESEPSSSSRDTNSEDSKKLITLKKDYLYYKNRVCDFCERACAKIMIIYVEGYLKKCGKK